MKTETILKEIHPSDLWYQFRQQIEVRRIIVHGGIETEHGFEMTRLTFNPPLSVNGMRMKEDIWIHCKHESRVDVFGELATYFEPRNGSRI